MRNAICLQATATKALRTIKVIFHIFLTFQSPRFIVTWFFFMCDLSLRKTSQSDEPPIYDCSSKVLWMLIESLAFLRFWTTAPSRCTATGSRKGRARTGPPSSRTAPRWTTSWAPPRTPTWCSWPRPEWPPLPPTEATTSHGRGKCQLPEARLAPPHLHWFVYILFVWNSAENWCIFVLVCPLSPINCPLNWK